MITADKIKYNEDRGYVLVSDEFPTGAHFDNDASVDQTWTVTLKHGVAESSLPVTLSKVRVRVHVAFST